MTTRRTSAVPVGVATGTGLAATLAAYTLAIIAFAHGDRTDETITALVIGTVTLLSVIWGRMLQAIALVKQAQR